MQPDRIRELLDKVAGGEMEAAEAFEKLRHLPYEELEFARVDHHRAMRQGWPEAIFSEGKTAEQVLAISEAIVNSGSNLLATRLSPEKFAPLADKIPSIRYNEVGRVAVAIQQSPPPGKKVVILTAGTSDIGVAEEAAETLGVLGHEVDRVYDVGVAGIHRLFSEGKRIGEAAAVSVLAGMEGARVSVVAGICASPVIGVPTSIGYGTSFGGIAALLGMLNSCASGVTVVNIDNGFGAACAAHRILRSSGEGE